MNTRIDDALDVIEFDTQNERTQLCRKQEATLPNYTVKMAGKLKKAIAKAVAKADHYDQTTVSRLNCHDRMFLCFGDRISHVNIMAYAKGSLHISIDWAFFIRDHKLGSVAGHQLVSCLANELADYRVYDHGQNHKHEHEIVIVRRTKGNA